MAAADLLMMDQENVALGGERAKDSTVSSVTVHKRHMKNQPGSASKRPALQSIGNSTRSFGGGQRNKLEEMEEVCLPAHLDPLLGLPSSIPSASLCSLSCHHTAYQSFTSLPSPVSPMLISTPSHHCESFSFLETAEDEFSSHYAQDIFTHLRESESLYHPIVGYMSSQPDITNTMRAILVDWLVEVCDEFHLLPETLFAAVVYVDRFLSYVSVPRSKLQLVGVTSLYIASKLEEIYPPELHEFAYITDDTYTKRQIVKMEQEILRVLSYNLIQPTSFTFLLRFLELSRQSTGPSMVEQVELLAKYICELTLLDADPFLKYFPSVIAASAVCLARHSLGFISWPFQLQYYCGYNVSDMSNCIQDLHRMHAMAQCHSQQAVRQKYNSDKLQRVASLKSPETLPF